MSPPKAPKWQCTCDPKDKWCNGCWRTGRLALVTQYGPPWLFSRLAALHEKAFRAAWRLVSQLHAHRPGLTDTGHVYLTGVFEDSDAKALYAAGWRQKPVYLTVGTVRAWTFNAKITPPRARELRSSPRHKRRKSNPAPSLGQFAAVAP